MLPVGYLSESGSRVNNEMRSTLVNWLVEIHVKMIFFSSVNWPLLISRF